jgi:hypothetical protein
MGGFYYDDDNNDDEIFFYNCEVLTQYVHRIKYLLKEYLHNKTCHYIRFMIEISNISAIIFNVMISIRRGVTISLRVLSIEFLTCGMMN